MNVVHNRLTLQNSLGRVATPGVDLLFIKLRLLGNASLATAAGSEQRTVPPAMDFNLCGIRTCGYYRYLELYSHDPRLLWSQRTSTKGVMLLNVLMHQPIIINIIHKFTKQLHKLKVTNLGNKKNTTLSLILCHQDDFFHSILFPHFTHNLSRSRGIHYSQPALYMHAP